MKKCILISYLLFYAGQFLFSQTADTFKNIDDKYSFKDIKFESSYEYVKGKMKLYSNNTYKPNTYKVTNSYYLTIGIFSVESELVNFWNNKLSDITFFIKTDEILKFDDIKDYFVRMFGIPEKVDDHYVWKGEKLAYILEEPGNNSEVLLLIHSQLLFKKNGEDNFK